MNNLQRNIWLIICLSLIGVISYSAVLLINNILKREKASVYAEARQQCYLLTDDLHCLLLESIKHPELNSFVPTQYWAEQKGIDSGGK